MYSLLRHLPLVFFSFPLILTFSLVPLEYDNIITTFEVTGSLTGATVAGPSRPILERTTARDRRVLKYGSILRRVPARLSGLCPQGCHRDAQSRPRCQNGRLEEGTCLSLTSFGCINAIGMYIFPSHDFIINHTSSLQYNNPTTATTTTTNSDNDYTIGGGTRAERDPTETLLSQGQP